MRFVRFVCLFAILSNMFAMAQSNRTLLVHQPNGLPIAQPVHEGVPLNLSRMPQRLPLSHRGARTFKPAVQLHGSRTTQPGILPDAGSIFVAAPTYGSGGTYASSVAAADVNGDGKPDLVVANNNNGSGTVGVLLGNGDGTFQTAVTYWSGGSNASSVAIADVNGDAKPDLVVGNGDGNVGVLLGNGDGTFQTAVSYGSGGCYASSVAVADVNEDGKPDVLVASRCGESGFGGQEGLVGVLLGKGDGTFQPVVTYDSGGVNAESVAVTDVNGDGKPDLVIANYCLPLDGYYECRGIYYGSGGVGVLLGNGDGTFQAAGKYESGGWIAFSVAVADVNGDGKPDLVVTNYCAAGSWKDRSDYLCTSENGVVGVLLGNGDGSFQSAVTYGTGGLYADSVVVADLNGDGKPDIVVADSNNRNGTVGLLFGNGDGTFRTVVAYDSGELYASSVAVADLNGDGKKDVLVANGCASVNCTNSNGTVGVLLGEGDGTFQAAGAYSPGGLFPDSVVVADVNGDGKPDLVVTNKCAGSNGTYCDQDFGPWDGSVGVLLGNGDGTFQPVVNFDSGGYYASSVAVADLNGDGKPDIVVANLCLSYFCESQANPNLGVLLGNGDGTFQPVVTYSSGGYSDESVVLADVNGDGKPDIVVADNNNGSGTVEVLLGNGDGTFQPAVGYNSGGGASSVAVADVNGDGKPDIVVANNNNGSGTVGVLLGNGDGTFQPAVGYNSGGGASSVAIADVNGDGKPDLLVANGGIGVLLGNGDGTFQAVTTISTPLPTTPGQLVVADFNSDGKLDIASSAGNFLLLGNGDGSFQSPLLLGAGGLGIAIGDFNNDGSPDLVVGGATILLNRIPHPQQTTTSVTSSQNPSNYGQAVTFTATVTAQYGGAPTGTVSFYDGTTNIGNSNLNNSGVATLTTSTLAVGTHSMTATYNGYANFLPSTSPVLYQVVQGAIAMLSPRSLNFGNQTVGITSSPQYVTLQNNGNINLTVTSIQINGANNGDFAQTNNCPGSVPPNNSCQISVTFTPTTTGTRNAAVTITDNAPDSPQSIPLKGVGVLPAVTFSPTNLTFPTQLIFTTSPALPITLTNKGLGTLLISKIAVAGAFAQTNNCPNSLGSGNYCTIQVRFHPKTRGIQNGAVSVTDNAPGSPQQVPLTGTGTFVQLAPTKLNFGTQPVGTRSLAKKITLTNKGNSAVKITGIAITGTDAGDFAETNTCGKSVGSGASCFIKVTFKPLAKGKRTANVSVYDNGGGSPQQATLIGTGT
jgi:hypothetical protein